MQVKTFEIENAVPQELEEGALQLVESLGLQGQKSLVAPDSDLDRNRIQYLEMTAQENVVYEALLPQKTIVVDYDGGIIPVRVLQVIAHGREMFTSLHVWYAEDHSCSPLLVGTLSNKHYVLARWGDKLESFDTLMEKARKTIRTKAEINLKSALVEAQSNLTNIDVLVDKKLAGEWVHF